MFLQEFGDHPNIVKLHNVIRAENDKDIYLVFEFMGERPNKSTILQSLKYLVLINSSFAM